MCGSLCGQSTLYADGPAISLQLAVSGLSLFLFARVEVATPYADLWYVLALAGFGMSIVMTPMTAAVMNSVPPERAGMASATTNAGREVGGVLGIALLGAIVTHILTGKLGGLIEGLGLPASVKEDILVQAGHGLSQVGADLSGSGGYEAVSMAVKEAFVSGMHVALMVAGVVLILGALVTFVFVRQAGVQRDLAPRIQEDRPGA